MKTLTEVLKNEKSLYDADLDCNPSFAPRTSDVLNLIDLYMSSKYRDGDLDSLNQRKVFFNISTIPVEVASKMLDIDQKDIILRAEDWASYWPAWIKEKELKMWLKLKYFGRQLDRYAYFFAKNGHLVVEKVGTDIKIVPMKNLIFRPDVNSFKETPLIQKYIYSEDYFVANGEKKGWNKYKDVKAKDGKVEFYSIYFPEGFNNDISKEDNYFLYVPSNEITLASLNKDSPYKDIRWEEIEGRTAGRGQVEKVFPEQIYLNRIANYKAYGLHWTSKHIYQTRTQNVGTNLLTQTEDGDVMTITSEVTPIANEERNLAVYRDEEQRYEQNATTRAFVHEPVTGERSPAGTTLGATMLQARMTAGFYKQKRDLLGSLVREILVDWVIPDFDKEYKKEHKILIKNLISGDDMTSQAFLKMIVGDKLRGRKLDFYKKGKAMSPEQEKIIRSILTEQTKFTEFPVRDGYYSNAKYTTDISITGEEVNTAAESQALWQLVTLLGQNPTVIRDPMIKNIIAKALNKSGFNPYDLGFYDEVESIEGVAAELRAQRGGSISAPISLATSATPVTTQQTVQ